MAAEVTREPYDFEANSAPQHGFHISHAPEVLLSSGLGKGKTRVLCEKADLMCRLYANNRVLVARRSLASMWGTTIECLLNKVIPPHQRANAWKPHALGQPTLFYPNGSQIWCLGTDNEERVLSAEFGAAYFDQVEEMEESEVSPGTPSGAGGRIRLGTVPWQQWGGVCNPREPAHWLCRRFRPDLVAPGGRRIERTKKETVFPDGTTMPAGALLRETWVSGAADNYGNLPPSYKLTLANTKGRYRMRLVDGLWVAFEGMVYDQWNTDAHTIARPEWWPRGYPPADWPRYRSIDFGFDHPFVCQWWTKDRAAGRYYMYREIYHSHRDIEEHRQRILELERDELRVLRQIEYDKPSTETADDVRRIKRRLPELEMTLTVADHDRGEREYLERRGVSTEPAKKDVNHGIQVVYTMLNVDGSGQPRIAFLRDALDGEPDPILEEKGKPTCSAESMASYRWKEAKPGAAAKEEPIKVDDDGADATRMLFDTIDEIGDDEE